MSKVRIVTDSTADIPREVREALGIEMVPLKVHFGEETYLDSVTIESQQFYEKLANSPSLPTTSQPSPAEFLEVYQKILAEPDTEIVSIHLSSAMSGTYQSAVLAKSLLGDDERIAVVDSKSASYGIALQVLKAAEASRAGKSKAECLELVETIRNRYRLYFLVDTLEYLQKGGRIGKAAAFFGSLLSIKPILTIDGDGEVASVDKVRGQKKAVGRIMELLKENPDFRGEVEVTIAHANSLSFAEEVAEQVQKEFTVAKQTFAPIGPVIGTHAGPGALGIFMLPVM